MTPTANAFEIAGRLKKVNAIMPVLIEAGVTADDVAGSLFNEKFWDLAASAAKVKNPSHETRRLIMAKMLKHEKGKQ